MIVQQGFRDADQRLIIFPGPGSQNFFELRARDSIELFREGEGSASQPSSCGSALDMYIANKISAALRLQRGMHKIHASSITLALSRTILA